MKDDMARAVAHEGLLNTLPVLKGNRQWGFLDFVWVQSGLSIATWAFLFGGFTASFVGFWDGMLAMLLGNSIAVILMMMASAAITCRWGAEHFILLRSVYGALGVFVLVLGLLPLVQIGWVTILALMFGRAGIQVINFYSGQNFALDSWLVQLLAVISLIIGWLFVVRGDRGVRQLNALVAPGLIIVSAVLVWYIFGQRSLADISAAPPATPTGDAKNDFMLAVELNFAAGLGWWQTMGNLSRTAKTQRAALWGIYIGLVPVAVLAQAVGFIAALALGKSDPTEWMLPIAGPIIGTIILVFIALANITSMAGLGYATCQAFVQHFGANLQKLLGWRKFCAIFFIIPVVLVLGFSTWLYENFFIFIAWTQALIAPAAGIAFFDYYVLRKGKIDLAGVYDLSPASKYHYWGRVNPAPVLALAIGIALYIAILNPLTLESSSIFKWISASLPAFVGAGVIHILLAKLIVIPSRKGDYEYAGM